MPKSFQFPVWLIGTKEEQVAEEERQNLARASHTRAKLNEAERLVGRGALLEQTARANIEAAKNQNRKARILAENQLADALADQGRFKEASTIHHDRQRRKYFRDIGKAIEMPDAAKCKCKDQCLSIGETELEITPRFERAKVFSPVHNQIVSIVECSRCGHKNARPLRSRLLHHNAAMTANEGTIRSESERKVLIADVQVFNERTV